MTKYFTAENIPPEIPVVAHIPHSSDYIPEWIHSQFSCSPEKLADELRILTDWDTDQLFKSLGDYGAAVVRYGVSRYVVDPERFPSDDQEIMSSKGMGVIYTLCSDGTPLRNCISDELRRLLLSEFYAPYHLFIEKAVSSILDQYGKCLILDCHSHPEFAQPYELRSDATRCDFSLGTYSPNTPDWLVASLSAGFKREGYSVGIDEPFAGTYVPLRYLRDSRVMSIMIEVNKRIYWDETLCCRTPQFESTQKVISSLLSDLIKRL